MVSLRKIEIALLEDRSDTLLNQIPQEVEVLVQNHF